MVISYQGWDDPYVPRTHEGLLKWKYARMNSVDFLYEVIYPICMIKFVVYVIPVCVQQPCLINSVIFNEVTIDRLVLMIVN